MYQTTYFVAYALIAGLLTIGLAVTLHAMCNVFLHAEASGAPKPLLSIARLLALGYYLVCGGYFAMTCPTEWQYRSVGEVAHVVSVKAGFFMLLLGAMVVVNAFFLTLFQRRMQEVS